MAGPKKIKSTNGQVFPGKPVTKKQADGVTRVVGYKTNKGAEAGPNPYRQKMVTPSGKNRPAGSLPMQPKLVNKPKSQQSSGPRTGVPAGGYKSPKK